MVAPPSWFGLLEEKEECVLPHHPHGPVCSLLHSTLALGQGWGIQVEVVAYPVPAEILHQQFLPCLLVMSSSSSFIPPSPPKTSTNHLTFGLSRSFWAVRQSPSHGWLEGLPLPYVPPKLPLLGSETPCTAPVKQLCHLIRLMTVLHYGKAAKDFAGPGRCVARQPSRFGAQETGKQRKGKAAAKC